MSQQITFAIPAPKWTVKKRTSIVDVRHMRFPLRSLLVLIGIVVVILALGAADVRQRRRQAVLEQEAIQAIESLGGHAGQMIACEPVWFHLIPTQMRPGIPGRVSVVEVPAFGPDETYVADVLTQLRVFRCLQHVGLSMQVWELARTDEGNMLRIEDIEAEFPDVYVGGLIN